MDEKDQNPKLTAFRAQIDALDDKLIALLTERIGIVRNVGELKRAMHPGECAIRAGREADMVRRIANKFKDSGFSPAAAAAIWRLLIGASTTVESPLTISAFVSDTNQDLYWLAREYFGPFIPVTKQPHIKRVIGDIIDGKAAVGIVPLPHSSDTTPWWTNLMEHGDESPKIFAHVPFVHYGTPAKDTPAGLAIGKIEPEPTEDDTSIIVIASDHNVSQSRLQTALANAGLKAQWISIATLAPTTRHHLLQVSGFITPEHTKMQAVQTALGASILSVHFLGAYATPFTL